MIRDTFPRTPEPWCRVSALFPVQLLCVKRIKTARFPRKPSVIDLRVLHIEEVWDFRVTWS